MYCTQCGKQNPEGAQFCSGCGRRLTIDSQRPAPSPSEAHAFSCYIHPGQPATGICVSCGQAICGECRVPIQGKNYCKRCSAELASRPIAQRGLAYGQQKSSGIAALLSFLWPGAGQIYNGQIGKGILLVLLQIVNFILMFVLIGFVTGFLLWVYGIYDAYHTAERINRGEIMT